MSLISSETAFELNADQETLLTTERVSWGWRGKVIPSFLGKPNARLSMEIPCHQKDKKQEALKGPGALGRPGRLEASPLTYVDHGVGNQTVHSWPDNWSVQPAVLPPAVGQQPSLDA